VDNEDDYFKNQIKNEDEEDDFDDFQDASHGGYA
jgi:hypothetical protein